MSEKEGTKVVDSFLKKKNVLASSSLLQINRMNPELTVTDTTELGSLHFSFYVNTYTNTESKRQIMIKLSAIR